MENGIRVHVRRFDFQVKIGRFKLGTNRRKSGAVADLNGTQYAVGDDGRTARGTSVRLGVIEVIVSRDGFRGDSALRVEEAGEGLQLDSRRDSLRISGSGGRIIVTPGNSVQDEIIIPLR